MEKISCQKCGNEVEKSSAFCTECGAPIKVELQQLNLVEARPVEARPVEARPVEARPVAILPAGVRGWSWGAFLLNFIWAIGNRVSWQS